MTVSEFINKVGFQVDQSSVQKVNSTVSNLKSTITKALGVIGIGISLSSLNAISEEFGQINTRIKSIVDSSEDLEEKQNEILEAANACKLSYSSMANYVEDLVSANSELFPVDDAVTFAEYVAKIGQNAGYSESEIASMYSSLTSIFQAGTASATNISTILSNTPALAKQLAEALGTTTDQLSAMADAGELTAETIKSAILSATDDIDAAFDQLDYNISDALLNIRNQWGFFVDSLDSTLEISQTIAKTMVKGFNQIMSVLNSLKSGLETMASYLGGTENLLKTLAIAASAFLVVMNWSKIVAGAEMFISALSAIKAALSIGNIGVLALIAAIAALLLIVDDFVNFMKGNDSVIGYCFEQAGIDADEMREKIVNIWNNLVAFFSGIWDSIKAIFEPAIEWVKEKLEDTFGDDMFSGIGTGLADVITTVENVTEQLANNKDLQDTIANIVVGIVGLVAAFNSVKDVVGVLSTAFATVNGVIKNVSKVFNGLKTAFNAVQTGVTFIKELVSAAKGATVVSQNMQVITKILTTLKNAFAVLSGPIGAVVAAVGVLVAAFVTLWTTSESFRDSITQSLSNIVSSAQEFAQGIIDRLNDVGINFENFQAVLSTLGDVFSIIVGVLQTVWMEFCNIVAPIFEGAFSAISTILSAVFDIITGILDVFIGLFTGNWSQLWTGVQEIFSGIWDAITGIFSTIFDTISGVAANIVSAFMDMAQQAWDAITGFDWLTLGSNVVQGIIDGITGMIGNVVSAAADIGSNILSGFCNILGIASPSTVMEEQAGYIIDGVVNGIAGLPDAMTDALNQALVVVQQWATQLVTTLGTSISTAVSNVGQYFSGMGQSISVALSGTLSVITTWGSSVMSTLQSALTGATNVAVGSFASLTNGVGSALSSALSVVTTWGSNVTKTLQSASQTALKNVTSQMSQMPTKMGTYFSSSLTKVKSFTSSLKSAMLSAGKAATSSMSSGMSGLSSSVSSRLSSVTSSVKSWGTSLTASFKSIGKNVISGMINGISSMVGSLYSSIKSALSGLVDKAKNALGIHSPSTVMEEEVGTQIPAGVGVGIEENEDAATSAIEDLAVASTNAASGILGNIAAAITGSEDTIREALQTAVSGISVMATASTVSPDTAMTATGGSTDNSRNINQNVSINNTFNGDKAIQRKAATAMDDSAEDITATLARGLAYSR